MNILQKIQKIFKKIIHYDLLFDNEIYFIDETGKSNRIKDIKKIKKYGKIRIEGKNNIIILPETEKLKFYIEISGNNNKIELKSIKDNSNINVWFGIPADNRNLYIDEIYYFGEVSFRINESNRSIKVGKNCMFSTNVYVWTTDAHKIYDIKTNKRINEDGDIIIGEHVWLGRNAYISKGVTIPNNTIVGAYSFVNKNFEDKNTIIAGIPAKVVKKGVNWE